MTTKMEEHRTFPRHKTNNSSSHTNHNRKHIKTDKYNKSSIYQMKCPDCPLKYIKQTRITFNTRYKEHREAIRNNSNNFTY